MSEKNGQSGAQWTKSVAAAAAAIQKPHNPYDNNNLTVYSGHCTIPGLQQQQQQQQPTDITYTSGRFQAPSIHHHGTSIAPSSGMPTLLQPQISPTMLPSPTPTNVPAPSGFVPPTFPTTPAAVTTTSVLTPNPFAAAASAAGSLSFAAGAASAFGMEQFQRLNAQQQLELGKIVNAMNTSGQNATSPSMANAQITGIAAAPQPTQPAHRAHGVDGAPGASNIGAINSTIAENVLNAISSSQGQMVQGRLIHAGVKAPDEGKMLRVQQVVEAGLDELSKQTISQILERVTTLKPIERLFLYLRLPGETAESDPLRQPQNPLGTRSEITHTINWVRSHLEHDPQVSIPKQDVYNDYIAYCERLNIKPLSTADFGKVMKQVFPGIRPRRLGTRGNSRYCYAAMRKTTQLTPPQLPQLGRSSASIAGTNNAAASVDCKTITADKTDGDDSESWDIVRNWAEKLLNVKLDSLKDLASRIKSNSTSGATVVAASALRLGPKKYTPREPKEKRLLADLGPLKKRRKKKRKGSTSSESSCNQLSTAKDATSSQDSTAYTSLPLASNTSLNSEDEQKAIKLKIKQEIMDSPNYQTSQTQAMLANVSPMPQNALLNDNYLSTAATQHQMMPMNLATEPRPVLAKATPSTTLRGQYAAARNLTPKIMEMSPNLNAHTQQHQPVSLVHMAPEQATLTQQQQQTLVAIKDEVDEYNTSNIFCKKVLKAQQTKGFWTNNNLVPPIITTTASTPPPTTQIDQTLNNTSVTSLSGTSPVTNLSMGPPQMSTTISVSPSSSLDVCGPKVVSRNMLLLRAKKAAAEAAAAAAGTDDTCLPENLGLPRERVISICNMDKHELDDYFLEEAENEEDQDTELLQYFQTGDAEEKRINSLDATENRNPTANSATNNTTTILINQQKTTATTLATTTLGAKQTAASIMQAASVPNLTQASSKSSLSTCGNGNVSLTTISVGIGSANNSLKVSRQNVALNNNKTTTRTAIGLPNTQTSNAVGSASASLALMSQKHQLQQQQQQQQFRQKQIQTTTQQQQQINKLNVNNNKRKISLSNATNHHNSNCFLPISPNINNSSTSSSGGVVSTTALNGTNSNGNANNANCFASPGLTRLRVRPPTLVKQQSLDFETSDNGSDPMIGASRRRPSFMRSMPSSTSASAPPSPSMLQQYNSSSNLHAWGFVNNTNSNNIYNDAANNVALLADQNSMDLENSLALASATGDVDFQLTPLNETQRSQSVPLSQLQRIQSPHANYSACNSVNQTPVPPEFAADSTTLFSEHSNSPTATLKLNTNDVLATDTTTLLDDVDVSAMLSPDFSTKFSSLAQTQHATTTCSSSTGSSSGYSSATCNTFGNMSSVSGIISRSVPSTPLPHHQQNSFGNSAFYDRRNNEFSLSPLMSGDMLGFGSSSSGGGGGVGGTSNNNNHNSSHNFYNSRTAYDISKSMPTTPITTPSFRYSPVDLQRDFLINGSTIDSMTSSNYGGGGGGGGAASVGADGLTVGNLSTDTLMDDSVPTSDVEAIIAGSDILGNL